MPISNVFLFIAITIAFVFLIVLGSIFSKKPGQDGEEETLRIIKNFIEWKGWTKNDYLLVNNLIFQKEDYWSCEIDILLLTRKWVYVIEVKDWGRGWLTGNLNHEYLWWSYPVGRQRWHERHQMYSPFYQNETHVKRFKSYFNCNQNVLNIVCFNSPYLEISLKEDIKSVFKNKPLWVSNNRDRNIADLLAHCERKETKLPFFEQLKKKISQEISSPDKVRKHQNWVKSVKKRKELERPWS